MNLVWVQCILPLGWQHMTIFIGMKCTEFTIQKKKNKEDDERKEFPKR